ncbi:hypothetical protein PAXRUDRAFT_314902 [Paxillus rubicundulus Ve08.2h10]|uniref:Uncharacterized protein n=1 Tax=Paxillus rubicundulus Ve08.2h10 TaxID=930991 RepID=A0A0D0CTD9_9AGAM|nr:hypothetical protein PAXRUDRAFT_314902 [Paxillus rubicundulus Ve08.2h10]
MTAPLTLTLRRFINSLPRAAGVTDISLGSTVTSHSSTPMINAIFVRISSALAHDHPWAHSCRPRRSLCPPASIEKRSHSRGLKMPLRDDGLWRHLALQTLFGSTTSCC